MKKPPDYETGGFLGPNVILETMALHIDPRSFR